MPEGLESAAAPPKFSILCARSACPSSRSALVSPAPGLSDGVGHASVSRAIEASARQRAATGNLALTKSRRRSLKLRPPGGVRAPIAGRISQETLRAARARLFGRTASGLFQDCRIAEFCAGARFSQETCRWGAWEPAAETAGEPSDSFAVHARALMRKQRRAERPVRFRTLLWEFDDHLGAIARLAQRLKHLRHLLDADHIGHHGARIDRARGQRVDRLLKVGVVVAEHEVEAELLENARNGRDLVGLHAYAEHDDSPQRRDHVDRRLQGRAHADTLED